MGDIALISPNAETTQRVLSKVPRVGTLLGFRVTTSKTEIYKRTHVPHERDHDVGKSDPPPPPRSIRSAIF